MQTVIKNLKHNNQSFIVDNIVLQIFWMFLEPISVIDKFALWIILKAHDACWSHWYHLWNDVNDRAYYAFNVLKSSSTSDVQKHQHQLHFIWFLKYFNSWTWPYSYPINGSKSIHNISMLIKNIILHPLFWAGYNKSHFHSTYMYMKIWSDKVVRCYISSSRLTFLLVCREWGRYITCQ